MMGENMKATLEFNLPEDFSDHLLAVNATSWALTALDLDTFLRNYLKYGHEFESADAAIEGIREDLCTILEDRNLSLEMIP